MHVCRVCSIRERGNEEATTKKIKESPGFLTIPKTEIENRERDKDVDVLLEVFFYTQEREREKEREEIHIYKMQEKESKRKKTLIRRSQGKKKCIH